MTEHLPQGDEVKQYLRVYLTAAFDTQRRLEDYDVVSLWLARPQLLLGHL